MRIIVLYNPSSGRGNAPSAAKKFAGALSRLGHRTELAEAGPGVDVGAVTHGLDALVIAGGDGTLHHAVAGLIRAGTGGGTVEPPGLYHLPLGTENLFARQFAMTPDPEDLHRILDAGRSRTVDVGLCNGRAFVLMCGIGPDAGVLARLNAASSENGRRKPITHRSYIRPIIEELLSLRPPVLTLSVNGETAAHQTAGFLVVGNSRQYAMRFDPAANASMSDGLLDAVFFPAASRASMLRWAIAARLRRHTRSSSLIYRTGIRIEVSTGGKPTAYQLDGEGLMSADGNLSITIVPRALRVWAPENPGVRGG